MTLHEVGLKLRRAWPELNEVQMSNEQLAQLILNRYPRLYDLISPAARRIKEISERTPLSDRWTEKGRLESVNMMVDINRKEAESMLYMDTAIRAAGEGVTVPAYEEMRKMDHAAKLEMEAKWEERRQSLEAIRLAQLDHHRTIDTLKDNLKKLYREEYAIEIGDDPPQVKEKFLALTRNLIKMFEGDINGRVRYLVPPPDRADLPEPDATDDAGIDNQSQAQGSIQRVAGPESGMGF